MASTKRRLDRQLGQSLSTNLNKIAWRERRWIPLVETHAYMCSAHELEYAR
jgi:hypothetical protein